MCLTTCLFRFSEKVLHVPELKPSQKFFQAKCSLSDERFHSPFSPLSFCDCLIIFFKGIGIVKVWTRTYKKKGQKTPQNFAVCIVF